MATSKMIQTLKDVFTVKEAQTDYNGYVRYIKLGLLVIVSGYIETSGNIAHGTVIASGLPGSMNGAAVLEVLNNNVVADISFAYVQSGGQLRIAGAKSGNRSNRISGAYICTE